MNTIHLSRTVCLIISVFSFPLSAFPQGSLTPPGPPGPTMKTLDQIEARTPLDATHTPGDANSEFIITQAGSYYLTGNLNVTKSTGIFISGIAGVTVDLNGFQIARVSGGASGILIFNGANNCSIRNGSITGFTYGIASDPATGGSAISHVTVSNGSFGLAIGDGWRIDRCHVHDNTSIGISTGDGCTISDCSASSNGAEGIVTGQDSIITGCTATSSGSHGIVTGQDSIITGCTATSNGSSGILPGQDSIITNCTAASNGSHGILPGSGCSIKNCVANNNSGDGINTPDSVSISDCLAKGNHGNGILTGSSAMLTNCMAQGNGTGTAGVGINVQGRSTVEHCTAIQNKAEGIEATGDCVIVGNHVDANGTGIHCTGSTSRIESNQVENNTGDGLQVDANRNFIARNTARNNGLNFVIVAGNRVAQIVVPATNAGLINGANSGSTDGFTGVDPWANFSF